MEHDTGEPGAILDPFAEMRPNGPLDGVARRLSVRVDGILPAVWRAGAEPSGDAYRTAFLTLALEIGTNGGVAEEEQ